MPDSGSESTNLVIEIGAFFAGFWIVSKLISTVQNRSRSAPASRDRPPSPSFVDDALRYYRALELPAGAPGVDIKNAYHRLLTLYHPDKVNHLGSELREVAQRRTMEIVEAYAYFERQGKFN